MAIKGYNSVNISNNVPFNNDPGQEINPGDMLYWNETYQAFQVGPGIVVPTKLSDFDNDSNYATTQEVQELLATLSSGGEISLDGLVTTDELQQAIGAIPVFSGDYADLTNAPYIPSIDGLATTAYVDQEIANVPVFSGNYNDLVNKPAIFSGSYLDLTDRPVTFSGDYNDLSNKPSVPADISELTDAQGLLYQGNDIDGLSSDTNTNTLTLDAGWDLVPATDGQQSLGSPDKRFTEIYIDNSTINIGDNAIEADENNNLLWNNQVVATQSYIQSVLPTPFSGDYNDLINTPDIPSLDGYATQAWAIEQLAEIQAGGEIDLSTFVTDTELQTQLANYQPTVDLSDYALKTELFSGDYADLSNLPIVPSDVSDLTDVQGLLGQASVDLTDYYTKTEVDALIPTTFSGDYNDLTNKPVIPSLDGYATVGYVNNQVTTAINNFENSLSLDDLVTSSELATAVNNIPVFSGDYNDLTNKPNTFNGSYLELTDRPVMFSGDYNDLTNKPDLTGYSTITYVDQQIANVSSGGQIDLSNYVTQSDLTQAISTISTPINLSAFNNDVGYVVNTDLNNYYTKGQVNTLLSGIQAGGSGGGASNISELDDVDDVAIGSLPQVANANEHYLLEYNPLTLMWESKDFGNVFATQQYVTETVATIVTDGDINLDGYATEQFVEQKLVERGDHFSGDYYDLTNRPMLFSGNYNDLVNIPVRKEYTLTSSGSTLNLVETAADPDQVVATVDFSDLGIGFSGNYEDLFNRPILFSGNYDDLANKPYIPSIAGLATEEYVDNRWAEPVITGERTFTHGIVFEDFVQQKLSTVNSQAVKRDLVLAVQTTNDIETEVLFSDGSRIDIATGTTAMFKATVVASSGAEKASFVVRGVIDRNDAGISIVGTNVIETIADSDLGWKADITAEGITNSLKITVTGSLSTTVDWTVFLEISEVIR